MGGYKDGVPLGRCGVVGCCYKDGVPLGRWIMLLLQRWGPARMGGDVGYLVVMVQMSHVGLGDTNIPSRWDGLLRFASRVGATKMASRWDAVVGWAFRWGVPVGRVVCVEASRWDG